MSLARHISLPFLPGNSRACRYPGSRLLYFFVFPFCLFFTSALITITVVVGGVVHIKPTGVPPVPFMRDVIFLFLAIGMILISAAVQEITVRRASLAGGCSWYIRYLARVHCLCFFSFAIALSDPTLFRSWILFFFFCMLLILSVTFLLLFGAPHRGHLDLRRSLRKDVVWLLRTMLSSTLSSVTTMSCAYIISAPDVPPVTISNRPYRRKIGPPAPLPHLRYPLPRPTTPTVVDGPVVSVDVQCVRVVCLQRPGLRKQDVAIHRCRQCQPSWTRGVGAPRPGQRRLCRVPR